MMRTNKTGWFLVAFFLICGAVLTVAAPQFWAGPGLIAGGLLLAIGFVLINRRASRAERLQFEGIPGEAQILELTQTGMYMNEQPVVRLKLLVEASGVPAFEAEHNYTVPLVALGALTSGGALLVYLDRTDPSRFMIDWFGGRLGS